MNPTPNFDPLAGIYRWLEFGSFGGALWRCRCHFLGELGACRSALVLGDGDGRFTARLLEVNPQVQVDAVDASPAMLRALMDRAGAQRGRVQTFCTDVRKWEPAGSTYDLVVSHFFLDCLTTEEVGALAGRLGGSVLPGGRWLISEFAVPESRFGRAVAQPVVSGLYGAFSVLTGLRVNRLPNYGHMLDKEGFILRQRHDHLGGMVVSELWSAGAAKLLQSC